MPPSAWISTTFYLSLRINVPVQVWTGSGLGPDQSRWSLAVPVLVPEFSSGTRLSGLRSSKNDPGPDQTKLPQHYRRLTKKKQGHVNQYPCTENGAEEAKSCGGTMLAMEHHGKLWAMHQRMHGGLRNVTVFPP